MKNFSTTKSWLAALLLILAFVPMICARITSYNVCYTKLLRVDNDRIALIGNGFGSYFATRVTVFDPRVRALVVNPPYLNLHRSFIEAIGQRAMMFDVDYHALNELPPSLMRGVIKLLVLNMCRRFGASRLQALVKATESYSVEDRNNFV